MPTICDWRCQIINLLIYLFYSTPNPTCNPFVRSNLKQVQTNTHVVEWSGVSDIRMSTKQTADKTKARELLSNDQDQIPNPKPNQPGRGTCLDRRSFLGGPSAAQHTLQHRDSCPINSAWIWIQCFNREQHNTTQHINTNVN